MIVIFPDVGEWYLCQVSIYLHASILCHRRDGNCTSSM